MCQPRARLSLGNHLGTPKWRQGFCIYSVFAAKRESKKDLNLRKRKEVFTLVELSFFGVFHFAEESWNTKKDSGWDPAEHERQEVRIMISSSAHLHLKEVLLMIGELRSSET